jgi:hypothetical protein
LPSRKLNIVHNFTRHKINPKSTNHIRSYSLTQKYTILWPEGSKHESQTPTRQPVWKGHEHIRYDLLEILLTTLHFAHDIIQLLRRHKILSGYRTSPLRTTRPSHPSSHRATALHMSYKQRCKTSLRLSARGRGNYYRVGLHATPPPPPTRRSARYLKFTSKWAQTPTPAVSVPF